MKTEVIQLHIQGKRYNLDLQKMGRSALIVFCVVLFLTHWVPKLTSSVPFEKPVTAKVEMVTPMADVNVPIAPVKPATPPVKRMMSVQTFSNQAKSLFDRGESYFPSIYKEALANDLPPYFSLGIAWKESNFKKEATGPLTKYGSARGLYQIIESTASSLLDIEDPQRLYDPEVAIWGGNKVLGTYRNWLSGKVDSRTPEVFAHFSLQNGAVYYKDQKIVDQKGESVPLLLMTAISYNGGPGVIVAGLKRDGMLVIDPMAKNRNIPIQSLDYVLQIHEHLYDFQYHFAYTIKDIDRSKIF